MTTTAPECKPGPSRLRPLSQSRKRHIGRIDASAPHKPSLPTMGVSCCWRYRKSCTASRSGYLRTYYKKYSTNEAAAAAAALWPGQARPAPGSIVIRPGSKWQCGRLAVCQTTLPQARSLSQCPSVPLAPTHPPETNMKAHGDKVWQMLESRKAGQHTFLRRGPFMTLSTPVVSRY